MEWRVASNPEKKPKRKHQVAEHISQEDCGRQVTATPARMDEGALPLKPSWLQIAVVSAWALSDALAQ